MAKDDDQGDLEKLLEMVEEPPIVRVVNLILSQAVTDHASAIHLEQEADEGRVRYRVDGVLHLVMQPPKQIFPAVLRPPPWPRWAVAKGRCIRPWAAPSAVRAAHRGSAGCKKS